MEYFDCYSTSGVPYKIEPDQPVGCFSVGVAPELLGRKWDSYSLALLHAFNPTRIRVTTGEVTCNWVLGRITVVVNEENVILRVTMEAYVALPSDCAHGHALGQKLKEKQ